jgi:hypothetical protein
MARQRTYYPGLNRRLYDLKYYMDEYFDRMKKITAVTDPELAALTDLRTAVNTATDALAEYKAPVWSP